MPPRVLIAGFKHETNTFSKLPTDLAAYKARAFHVGEEVMRAGYTDTNTEIWGFMEACEKYGWEPILAVAADATPSGLVTRDAFEAATGHMLMALEKQGPVDAVLLQLHGAMVAEDHDDGESAVLALIREKVGPDIPIGVTQDLHANVTDKTAELADVIVGYRTYPHIDQRDTALKVAALVKRTLDGEIRPRITLARPALLDGVDHGRTTSPGPMLEAIKLADDLTEKHGLLAASINAGFPWADVDYAGPTAIVVADEGNNGAETAAKALGDEIWRTREEMTIDLVSAGDAVEQALATGAPGKPFVIADYADNPGGGGYTDSTCLLQTMISAGVENAAFSALYDPESVIACEAAGEGAEVALEIGGKCDPISGDPIEATALVVGLHEGTFKLEGPMSTGVGVNIGPAAVIRIGGVDIVLASRRAQNYDLQFFRAFGIEPTEKSILGVKSAQHFRADYTPIASGIAVVDDGNGITSHNFKALEFRKLRRPIWPLDDI